MNATLSIYVATAVALTGLGVYGVLTAADVLRKLLALNLLGSAVFLLLVVLSAQAEAVLDPLSQALVLTGMVVAVAFTGLALALLTAVQRRSGHADLDADDDAGAD